MKKAVFLILMFLLMFGFGAFSAFASGVPEMGSPDDTLLCIPEQATKSTGNDEDNYIENYNLRIEGPERKTITLYPGGTRHYTTGLKPGNYTAVEFSSVNKESGAVTASRNIEIPFTIRAGYITIFPAEVVCELTKVYGALRQSGEINTISSSRARSILYDVKSQDEFAWSWDTKSYQVYQYAQGGSLAGTGIKQAAQAPQPSTPTSSRTTGSSSGGTAGIAVMTFNIKNAPLSAGLLVGDMFEVIINSRGDFKLIERGRRESLMCSAGYDPLACTDPACQRNAAGVLDVGQYVSGTVTKVGSRFMLHVSLMNVDSGASVSQTNRTFESFDDLFKQIPDVVDDLNL